MAVDAVVIRSRWLLLAHRHVDLLADELDTGDRPDLDAGDPHRRSLFEAGDIVEPRLKVISLPEKASIAGQRENRERDNHKGHDCEDADLELGPG